MKKIVVMPLDERPCNYKFIKEMTKETDYEIVLPPYELLSKKKTPGDLEGLGEWLLKAAKDAHGLVIAIDTLLYSGIIPSRLHYWDEETLKSRLKVLSTIRSEYPTLEIYAYNLIMRNPSYSSSEEEPDYYEDWGRDIHRYGYIQHKMELKRASEEEVEEFHAIKSRLPQKYLDDYLNRRDINFSMNQEFLGLLRDGVIDFGILPQDDSSMYGLTALDQQRVRKIISDYKINLKAYMYPGADEVTNTLVARMINKDQNVTPVIKVHYTSPMGPQLIPPYEDRPLGVTLSYQILAAGGVVGDSMDAADCIMIVNTPGGAMLEASQYSKRGIEYTVFRNLVEAVEKAAEAVSNNKTVIIGDVAYANGGDPDLVKLLGEKDLLFKVGGYAGWNTSSNTLGTCIPQGMLHHLYGNTKSHRDFLGLRYAEDLGYCTFVRQDISQNLVKKMGLSSRLLDGKSGKVAKTIHEDLQRFVDDFIQDSTYSIHVLNSFQPWNRMFEVGLDVKVDKNER